LTIHQRDIIQAQLEDLKPIDDSAIKVQLTDLRRTLDETQIKLQQKNQVANQFARKIEEDTKKAEAARKQIVDIADAKAKRESLQNELTKSLEDEAKLKALLADTPVQEAPPPKIVTLPDPRPAPEGARPVTFLCANNRVYPIAADDWRNKIRQRAEFIVKSKRLNGGPTVGVNEERFMKEFKKTSRLLRDDFFEIELYAAGIYPRLKFIPKEKGGATLDEVLKPRSRFRKMLFVLDKNKYYARFIVLPDSYEVYLAARSVALQQRLLAGWEPQSANWQYTTHLGGPTLFGPQPPPNPNPRPAAPSKRANVID